MGYLSQIVQDARPRATPSLYTHAAVAPKAVAEPLSYARLMESGEASDGVSKTQSETPSRALNPETTEGEEVPFSSPQARPQIAARPNGRSAGAPADPTQPDGRMPSPPTEPAKDTAFNQSDIAPNHATTPKHQPQISGVTPRPASFDVPSSAPEAPGTQQQAFAATHNAALQEQTPGVLPATPPTEGAETIAPRVLAPNPTPPQTASIVPRITAAQTQSNSTPTAAPPQNQHAIQPASPTQSSAPAEVHIGEVEIIVQDPPAPRAAPNPRAANAAPSPARYHIRRL